MARIRNETPFEAFIQGLVMGFVLAGIAGLLFL